jgi:hypothetical protein
MVAMVKCLSSVIITVVSSTVAFGTASPLSAATAQRAVTAAPRTRAVTTHNPCGNPGGMLQPTPGFDPNTASDAELRAQDFPPRPRPGEPGEGLAAWNQYVAWYLTGQVYVCLPNRVPQVQIQVVSLGPPTSIVLAARERASRTRSRL